MKGLDMKVLDMKMHRNKSLTMKVLLGLVVAGCILPLQVGAQTNIHDFVACLNSLPSDAKVDVAASTCVPKGCFYTNTMSQESAQNACILNDGTRLPRVIFSCAETGAQPGGNQILRYRPSFSLCTLGNDFTRSVINHIEVGEDQHTIRDSGYVQKMADIAAPPEGTTIHVTEFGTGTTAIVDTLVPANNKGCANCHDNLGHQPDVVTPSVMINLFRQVLPELKEGTISTNDPTVVAPANPVPLSQICTGIANSSQLKNNPSKYALANSLCKILLDKEQ